MAFLVFSCGTWYQRPEMSDQGSVGFDGEVAVQVEASHEQQGQDTLEDNGSTSRAVGASVMWSAVTSGLTEEVARGFLSELGIAEGAPPDMLAHFDEEDIVAARRSFRVGPEETPCTAMQRAQVNRWLHTLQEEEPERTPAQTREVLPPAPEQPGDARLGQNSLSHATRARAPLPGEPSGSAPMLPLRSSRGRSLALESQSSNSLV